MERCFEFRDRSSIKRWREQVLEICVNRERLQLVDRLMLAVPNVNNGRGLGKAGAGSTLVAKKWSVLRRLSFPAGRA